MSDPLQRKVDALRATICALIADEEGGCDKKHLNGVLAPLVEARDTRADTAELAALRAERDRLVFRVYHADESDDCPFCERYSATGAPQECPMCPLCNLEEAAESNRQHIAALRDRVERAESDAAESKRRCGEMETLLREIEASDRAAAEELKAVGIEADLKFADRIAALTPEASK